jgi:hypothetical protein
VRMTKKLHIFVVSLLSSYFVFAQNSTTSIQEKTEVQVAICESESIVREKLGTDRWKLKRQLQTRLVDTSELELYNSGLVFRIRINTEKDKVEVALKKKVANDYRSERYSAQLDCEFDQHQQQRKRTCKMSYEITLHQWQSVLNEEHPLELLSPSQLGWLQELNYILPNGLRMTDEISGPSYTQKTPQYEKMLDMTTDRRGIEYIEISAKVPTDLINTVEADLLKELNEKNIQICDREMSRLTYRKLTSFFGF